MTVKLERTSFGVTATGISVELFTFTHSNGTTMSVTNYGGIIQALWVPDQHGALADIVLGYDTLAQYESDTRFLGCVIGRCANRIADGHFTLDGVSHQLEVNAGSNHIHGGSEGFQKQVWQASIDQADGVPQLTLTHRSADGHAGYPGNLDCTVTYRLTDMADVAITYHAVTDKPTIVNLTNHSYFNLAGHDKATENGVLEHVASLNCDSFLPTNEHGIPVGAPVSVVGTSMDFTSPTSFAARIDNHETWLKNGDGYDHNWVVIKEHDGITHAATITDPDSGRSLQVLTTQPGLQVYTGNKIDNLHGKQGAVYQRRGGVCLETQHFPDSANNPEYPPVVVRPDSPYSQMTVFRLGVV